MKIGAKISLVFVLLFSSLKFDEVYTQMPGATIIDNENPQMNLKLNLGEDFEDSKVFSVWGWFKPNLDEDGATNVVSINKVQMMMPADDPDFSACPYTADELEEDENLVKSPEVVDNENCFKEEEEVIFEVFSLVYKL